MNNRSDKLLILALALLGAAACAVTVIATRKPAPEPRAEKPRPRQQARRAVPGTPAALADGTAAPEDSAASPAAPRPRRSWPEASGARKPPSRPASTRPGEKTEPEVPLAAARVALAHVGADPQAEALWVRAINDPALPAEQRKDLIEDLNEEGFADPHNVTAAELPIVERRLDLIEQLAPNAMDETNSAAFAEAYKDLLDIRDRLRAAGRD